MLARWGRGGRPVVLAFALCFAALLVAGLRAPPRDLSYGDQSFYATTAWDLLRWGTFSDGFFDRVDSAVEAPPPGMFLGPVYPLLLAGVMSVEPALREAAGCMVQHTPSADVAARCPAYGGLVRPLHMALVAGALAFLMAAARRVSGSLAVAGLATGIGLVLCLAYARLFSLAMTESLALFLFSGAAYTFMRALLDGGRGAALLGGLFFGLLLLTRPSHVVLLPLALLALLYVAMRPAPSGRRIAATALFALGVAAVTLPWAARNEAVLGRFALTAGYGPAVLIERMAYNEMTPGEFGASFLYWLPDFGDRLAERLFGHETVRRLDWNQPDSLYDIGQHRRHAALEAPGRIDDLVPGLLRDEVIGRPVAYAASTLSLAWRGLWVGRNVGIVVILLLPLGLMAAHRARRLRLWALYAAPAWIMLVVHAGASVNQERYNLALILGLSVAAAWAILSLAAKRWPALRGAQA
ncbi:hypothetical protein [Roseomonas sp. KE2513]|uniref:hypothetical protein n=1 Tax=Roseomonas sp. KE2513 TaxID=2479202 RepID=UPI001E4E0D7A|nr:hypothetical protein [Roseomonas sp. KE2513]